MNHPYEGLSQASALAALNAEQAEIIPLAQKHVLHRSPAEHTALARYYQNVLMFSTLFPDAKTNTNAVGSHLLACVTMLQHQTAELIRCLHDDAFRAQIIQSYRDAEAAQAKAQSEAAAAQAKAQSEAAPAPEAPADEDDGA